MGKKRDHSFTPIAGKRGDNDTTQAACTCGWKGAVYVDDIRHGNTDSYTKAYTAWANHQDKKK